MATMSLEQWADFQRDLQAMTLHLESVAHEIRKSVDALDVAVTQMERDLAAMRHRLGHAATKSARIQGTWPDGNA